MQSFSVEITLATAPLSEAAVVATESGALSEARAGTLSKGWSAAWSECSTRRRWRQSGQLLPLFGCQHASDTKQVFHIDVIHRLLRLAKLVTRLANFGIRGIGTK